MTIVQNTVVKQSDIDYIKTYYSTVKNYNSRNKATCRTFLQCAIFESKLQTEDRLTPVHKSCW
jgi:predicted metallopeptidase